MREGKFVGTKVVRMPGKAFGMKERPYDRVHVGKEAGLAHFLWGGGGDPKNEPTDTTKKSIL